MTRRNRGANAQSHIHELLGPYCYAVEKFGSYLQDLALRGTLGMDRGLMNSALTLGCSELGYSPILKYGKKRLQLARVPNVFNWTNREVVDTNSGVLKSVYVPHCTALRLVIACMETGLLFDSLQWLDRRNWYRRNRNPGCDGGAFPVRVVIYERRSGLAQTVNVPLRLRYVLQREASFQKSFADANRYAPGNYGKGESTFDQVRPLFRDVNGGLPIDHSECSRTWNQLQLGFSEFCTQHLGEHHALPAMKLNTFPRSDLGYVAAQSRSADGRALTWHQEQKRVLNFYRELARDPS